MREWWSRFRGWAGGRRALSDDLREEMRAHVEMQADDYMDRGLSPEAARLTARRDFGNGAAVSERARDAWGFPALESLFKDIRHGFRAMRRAPAFSLIIILTFALGVGLNTAIFSVVHAVLLKPLPYPSPERLVWLGESTGKAEGISVSWVNYRHWRESNRTFDDLAAFRFTDMTMTGNGEPLISRGLTATSAYFPLLGMRPLMGRLFEPSDDRPGADPVILLSHRLWSRRFGGDPRIVGRTVVLDGTSFAVAGVLAPLWEPWNVEVDYYLPLGRILGNVVDRTQHNSMRVVGRLRAGITLAAARADIDGIMARLDEADSSAEKGHRSSGRFLAEFATGSMSGTLKVLMGGAVLILLIACANVASLLLARNTARAGELAVRKAIGAGAFRLVRQLLTETIVITAIGGLAGVAFAWWALRLIVSFGPREIPRLAETSVDPTALLFACGVTLAAGLIAGLAPVATAGRIDLTTALKESARGGGAGRRRQAFRSALVIAEVGLTLVLAFGSGLLLRSLAAAQASSPGYDARGVVSFSLQLPARAYRSPESVAEFYGRLLSGLRAIPGAAGAALIGCQPGIGECSDWFYSIPGRPTPDRNDVPLSNINIAGAGYFQTMRVPIRQGREFNETDRADGVKVAIVNESFARTWWPAESAIGRQIKIGGPYQNGPLVEIVGVAADIRQSGLDSQARPEIFFPYTQRGVRQMTIVARAAGDPAPLAEAVRRQVAALDRDLPVHRLAFLEQALGEGLARRRFSTLLLTCFAALAMILAAIGIYGLLSYWVSSREPEIAIRLALGARPSGMLRWTGLQALRLAIIGIGLGAIGGWAAARALENLVFGIPARDPATLVAAAILVLFIAFAAAAIPAWRASQVDPARRLHSF